MSSGFTHDKARKVAERCGDAEIAYVIYRLISESERNYQDAKELEEKLFDLQLQISVLLVKIASKSAESGSNLRDGVVLDERYVSSMRGPRADIVYMDEASQMQERVDALMEWALDRKRITDTQLNVDDVKPDGKIVDGTV